MVDFYKKLSSLANFKNVYKYYPTKRGISRLGQCVVFLGKTFPLTVLLYFQEYEW